MPCFFCEMGSCLTHIVREYDYDEALRALHWRTSEPIPEPRLLFDIRNRTTPGEPLPSSPGLDPLQRRLLDLEREIRILESDHQQRREERQRQQEREEEADRREAEQLLDEADEALRFIIETGFRQLDVLVSKLGQVRPRPDNFDSLNELRNKTFHFVHHVAVQKQHQSKALRDRLSSRESPGKLLEGARKLMGTVEQISASFNDAASKLLGELKRHQPSQSSSRSAPLPAILFHATTRATDLAARFPMVCSNALRLAHDMINHPTDGPTGFTVFGHPVYHSSRGSLRAGSGRGTAFWTYNNGSCQLIAMGEHTGTVTGVYLIRWMAQGVTVKTTGDSNVVSLNSTTRKLT